MESDGGMWKSDSLKETVIGCEVVCEARRECEGGRKRKKRACVREQMKVSKEGSNGRGLLQEGGKGIPPPSQ